MYYMDREGHRIKKTTSQDKFLKFVYTHTATRVLMRPLLLPAVSTGWEAVEYKSVRCFCPGIERSVCNCTPCEKGTALYHYRIRFSLESPVR